MRIWRALHLTERLICLNSHIFYRITDLVRRIIPCYIRSRGRQVTFYSREESAVENTIPIFFEQPDHVTFVSSIHLRYKVPPKCRRKDPNKVVGWRNGIREFFCGARRYQSLYDLADRDIPPEPKAS